MDYRDLRHVFTMLEIPCWIGIVSYRSPCNIQAISWEFLWTTISPRKFSVLYEYNYDENYQILCYML